MIVFKRAHFSISVPVGLVLSMTIMGELHAHGDDHTDMPDLAVQQGQDTDTIDANVFAADIVRDPPPALINVSVGGLWSAVYDWPLVAVHAALLPNGKVLAWDATPDDSDDDPHTTDNYTTRVTLWDPITDTHQETNNDTDTDLFCAGSAHLWDGRILFAGGDGGRAGANGPLANSNIYNPVTNTWHRTENMNAPRWYSSVAALSNGEMLTLGGTYEPSPLAEVFQFDQTWRALLGSYPIELTGDYQWLQQTPEGTVISFGPSNLILDIDTEETGQFTPSTTRDSVENRDYGSYAMYTTGKILVAGGEQGLSSAVIIDTATRQTTDTNPLSYGRRQHNLTILADGSVLATGGNSDGALYYSPTAPVMVPELWNAETQIWTELNTIPTDRQYHSIAMLLPDGKVLSAGGGICGDCYALGYEERNAEIFTPPYFFNSDGSLADQPAISAVPNAANYSQPVSIGLSHNKPISKAHLIKIGSVTHSENQDQRLVPLRFTSTANGLNLSMPSSRHEAPPGHYLLFVVDDAGVASSGSMVKLGQPLIGAEEVVRSSLELNTTDTYLTQPSTDAISIDLNAQPGTSLQAALNSANVQSVGTSALCAVVVDSTGRANCEFNTTSGSAIHISISGNVRSDYTLSYRNVAPTVTNVTTEEPVENVEPETPTTSVPVTDNPVDGGTQSEEANTDAAGELTDGLGVVRTGGGFISQFFVLLMGIFVLFRTFCGLRRRV